MTNDQFASHHGYTTFEEMIDLSTIVLSIYGELWIISPTGNEFLAWVDKHYDQPLGCFETFEEAESYIVGLCRALCVLSQKL
ncbi:hypothetical protein [Desulfosporosinus sp. Sb-LF]|uniref:hypothetical protein n=1 Tax=Desulfosporosinus sp. Sb-LF TaxID=2560027 RepID=UPI00107F3353|nr:hypothetical protein [Desulfosporosinus sp. Sb-LF]TGE32124.1 hypothetical protein E4K68_13460 [Desulfosporosinus sp. Sb-LF]